MDKRGYTEIESPPNPINSNGGAIKKKVRFGERRSFENNGNLINFGNVNVDLNVVLNEAGFDVNDLYFDDDDDLDLANVSKLIIFTTSSEIKIFYRNTKKTHWIFLPLSDA